MDEFEKQAVSVLEGLDETGNALLGTVRGIPAAGNPHYTLSQRWAYERQKGSKTACFICNILTLMFKPFYWNVKNYDHCQSAISDFPPDLPSEG
jgi:hypothetical protein